MEGRCSKWDMIWYKSPLSFSLTSLSHNLIWLMFSQILRIESRVDGQGRLLVTWLVESTNCICISLRVTAAFSQNLEKDKRKVIWSWGTPLHRIQLKTSLSFLCNKVCPFPVFLFVFFSLMTSREDHKITFLKYCTLQNRINKQLKKGSSIRSFSSFCQLLLFYLPFFVTRRLWASDNKVIKAWQENMLMKFVPSPKGFILRCWKKKETFSKFKRA